MGDWELYPLSPTTCPAEQRSSAPTVGDHRYYPRDLDGHDLAPMVNGQMELKAKEPAHRGGARWASPRNTLLRLIRAL